MIGGDHLREAFRTEIVELRWRRMLLKFLPSWMQAGRRSITATEEHSQQKNEKDSRPLEKQPAPYNPWNDFQHQMKGKLSQHSKDAVKQLYLQWKKEKGIVTKRELRARNRAKLEQESLRQQTQPSCETCRQKAGANGSVDSSGRSPPSWEPPEDRQKKIDQFFKKHGETRTEQVEQVIHDFEMINADPVEGTANPTQ